MARAAGAGAAVRRLGRHLTLGLLALAAASKGFAASAPEPLTLEQAASRSAPNFTPAFGGRFVAVTGQVSWYPVRLLGYTHLAIQDGKRGLVLESSASAFEGLSPGDRLRVEGKISMRGGMPVLAPSKIERIASGPPPVPMVAQPERLQNFEHLGLLVTTEGHILSLGANAGGSYMVIGSPPKTLKVFLPSVPGEPRLRFEGFARGDRVRATGIASQYCPLAPHNDLFQLLVRSSSDVIRTSEAWWVEPWEVALGAAVVSAMAALWILGERRSRRHRSVSRAMYSLGEEVLGAGSAVEIAQRLGSVLPGIFGITRVRLYTYNRASRTLERIAAQEDEEAISIPLESPGTAVEHAVVTCFRNRTALSIPDTQRSPFASAEPEMDRSTRSVLVLPLLAQGEVEGVLKLGHERRERGWSANDQAMVQHLANQAGLAVKLFEQRSMRDQLHRSEKLAAVGQLISGVVNDLRAPLATIASQAEAALSVAPEERLEHSLRTIASEAGRAADTVSRLVSFAHSDRDESKPVDMRRLLREMMEFREREWKVRGIRVEVQFGTGPVVVSGSRGQLEKVILNLIVHAEQALDSTTEKRLLIGARVLAGRAIVSVGFETPQGAAVTDPFAPGAADSGLAVCRGIASGHGGEIRFERTSSVASFQLDLPALVSERRGGPVRSSREARGEARELTVLSIEPDQTAQSQLIELLASRGLRVVPVRSLDEGLDLVQRLRFDAVFCPLTIPGTDLVGPLRKLQDRVGTVVVLSDTANCEPPNECLMLSKPVEEEALEAILESIELSKFATASRA